MASKKLVLFGAGKIGRSFIAQLFSRSGYEVVFIDVDQRVVNALNTLGRYQVVIKSEGDDEIIWVENVRGVLASDEMVTNEIASADIMGTAVGQNVLAQIAPVVAKGIEQRFEKNQDTPLDIILAENLREAAMVFKIELKKYLPKSLDFDRFIGLIETSIGKMVPIMPKSLTVNDPLLVFAEPYNTLILDKKAFKNTLPKVEGLSPKDNMPAWVDRKSFIHNLGHATAAYYGFTAYPHLVYLSDIMEKADVHQNTRMTMVQAAEILKQNYPGEFTIDDLTTHIDDLLHRFSNRALGDTVFRVGQDLYRKLGPEDRLVGALILALKHKLPYDRILFSIVCAMDFKATDEHGHRSASDEQFIDETRLGISHILESVCDLPKIKYPEIHEKAVSFHIKNIE